VAKYTIELSMEQIMKYFPPDAGFLHLCARELNLEAEHNITILAMTFTDSLYRSMPGVTIDVKTTQIDFMKAPWV
jgi:hypothetical protein